MKRNRGSTGIAKVGDVLPQLMVKYGLHRRQNLEQIEEAWRRAVGEPYATVTQVTKLYRGTLTIKVPHNAYIQELSFRHSELIDTLATLLEGEKVKKIKLVIND